MSKCEINKTSVNMYQENNIDSKKEVKKREVSKTATKNKDAAKVFLMDESDKYMEIFDPIEVTQYNKNQSDDETDIYVWHAERA